MNEEWIPSEDWIREFNEEKDEEEWCENWKKENAESRK